MTNRDRTCHICKDDPKIMPFCSAVHPEKQRRTVTAIIHNKGYTPHKLDPDLFEKDENDE